MNNQHTPILFPYEPDDLWEKIRQLLRSELQKMKATDEKPVNYEVSGMMQKPLYKATEVCKMLQVSRQTLHAYAKEGLLKPYKIKSRVFYLWSDIEKLMLQRTCN